MTALDRPQAVAAPSTRPGDGGRPADLQSFLLEYRDDRGLSQAQFAKALRVSQTWYHRLETGKVEWTQPLVEAAVQFLQLPPGQRVLMYYLALGHPPYAEWRQPHRVQASALVNDYPHPAVLTAPLGGYVAVNEAYREFFPGSENHRSAAETFLIDPVSRSHLLRRRDWETYIVRKMRSTIATIPADQQARADELLRQVRAATPHLEELWQEPYLGVPLPTRILWVEHDGEPTGLLAIRTHPLADLHYSIHWMVPDPAAVFPGHDAPPGPP